MHVIRYLGVLAPSSNCSILIETPPLAGKACWENDLSVAPMGLTNSKFDQLGLYQELDTQVFYCSKNSSGWKPTHITSVNIRIYICLSPHGTTNTPWVLRDTDVHRENTDVG